MVSLPFPESIISESPEVFSIESLPKPVDTVTASAWSIEIMLLPAPASIKTFAPMLKTASSSPPAYIDE